MKKTLIFALACTSLLACNQSTKSTTIKSETPEVKAHRLGIIPTYPPYSRFISIDTANLMLNSYLNSINAPANDSDIASLIVNADSLRVLLGDSSIKNVKIMFAHTMNYVNSGRANMKCGYQSGALTTIIAGYDINGNYKYSPANMVLDMAAPCPPNCPVSGTAAQNTLTY